jgi:hypothetical protein
MRTNHSGMVFTGPDAYSGIDVGSDHNCCVGVDGVEHGVKGGAELLMLHIIAGEVCQDEGDCEQFAFDTLPVDVEGVNFDIQLDESPHKVIIYNHDQIGVGLLGVTSLAKTIASTLKCWPHWLYLFMVTMARAVAVVVAVVWQWP